jgi:threonine dehydrogenase-like Zn-dependent dehydrogenase
MKAISLVPGTSTLRLVDRPEPSITQSDEVKLQVLQVGVCGTDREEAAGGRAAAPPGQQELIMGHEMIGQVVQAGPSVTTVRPGDFAVLTVRRGCGHCPACGVHRSDMCYTGDYADRGITLQDGYQAEYVVDSERYVVRVPKEIAPIGVLCEPMSIAQKAIDEALLIQTARLPDADSREEWLTGKRALVAGLGPVGLLAAFALRLRGANVLGLDVIDADNERARLLNECGGVYVDGRQERPDVLDDHFGQIDLIIEAAGVAHLEFDLLAALGRNGVYVVVGIPDGDRVIDIDGAAIVRGLVLGNQVMLGSVNAGRRHFDIAIRDLAKAAQTWRGSLQRLITHRLPYTQFEEALKAHPADEIKAVMEWAPFADAEYAGQGGHSS